MQQFSTRALCALFALMIGFLPQNLLAQRNCGTMEVLEQMLQQNPAMQERMEEIEQHTRDFRPTESERATVHTIPVVVHVIYNTSAENISEAQIMSQIQVMNDDFRRLNADADNTWPQAADTEIQFCLATVDPNGNATNGITRTSTSVTSWSTNDNMKFSSQGGKDAWDRDRYLNMWVVDISGGILGYAQFPGGSAATDGVVMDYQYFGTVGQATAPFDLGRTTTHEIGHWLNLRHIWGDGNCNADDFVSDTPASDGANYGCATSHVSCSSLDMVQNYMDYSDDACMNLFTAGQTSRMRAVLAPGGFRNSLLSSNGCGSAPAPTCTDGVQNGNETGVDCGGPDCAPCSSGCNDNAVTVTINLDNYPEETSWTITNSGGTTVASGGTYGSQPDGSTVSEDLCLVDGCYTFTINDAYGDGICCSYGNGSYSVTDGSGVLASGGAFASSESTNFCVGGGPAPSCDDGVQNGDEEGVDCGGSSCPACPVVPTCSDGIQNGNETGVDCGGPDCAPCGGGGCTYTTINFNNFEGGWGIWNDGGSDCTRSSNSAYAYSGTRTMRLRDNTSSSVSTTDNLNLAGYDEVTINFTYVGVSMENGEDFWLQASTNGGGSYTTLVSWARGADFVNDVREFESVVITGTFTANTRFRFRCDASGNSDWVYIDDVEILGCQNGNRTGDPLAAATREQNGSNDVVSDIQDQTPSIKIFPNPVRTELQLNISQKDFSATIIDATGRPVRTLELAKGNNRIATDQLTAGMYFMVIYNEEGYRETRRFVVAK